ncbi:MAG: hypothetical protein AAGA64_11985 [Bacteroidota bacterium]
MNFKLPMILYLALTFLSTSCSAVMISPKNQMLLADKNGKYYFWSDNTIYRISIRRSLFLSEPYFAGFYPDYQISYMIHGEYTDLIQGKDSSLYILPIKRRPDVRYWAWLADSLEQTISKTKFSQAYYQLALDKLQLSSAKLLEKSERLAVPADLKNLHAWKKSLLGFLEEWSVVQGDSITFQTIREAQIWHEDEN